MDSMNCYPVAGDIQQEDGEVTNDPRSDIGMGGTGP